MRAVRQAVQPDRAHLPAYRARSLVPGVQVGQDPPGDEHVLRQDGAKELMFERLRARLEAAMAAATKAEDPRTAVGRMREALIEMLAAVGPMRDAVAETDRQLAAARAELETARRRRDMAATIGDQETVTVAEKYATKLGERVAVLERKAAAQREE